MGRTIPTVNQVLEQNREHWARFYRALRREDRELLDRLFDGAKYFTAACVYQAHVTPSESIFLAMLLHLQKQVQELHVKLEAHNGTSPGMDSRSVSDSHGNGSLDHRARREPPLSFPVAVQGKSHGPSRNSSNKPRGGPHALLEEKSVPQSIRPNIDPHAGRRLQYCDL